MRNLTTKKLLLFLLAHTVSLYIFSAERPLLDTSFDTISKRIAEGNMSSDDLLQIFKERAKKLIEKINKIMHEYEKEVQKINQQSENNIERCEQIIEKKGLDNDQGCNALMQRDRECGRKREEIKTITKNATVDIEDDMEKRTREEKALIMLWMKRYQKAKL